jgi:hypothetical protein
MSVRIDETGDNRLPGRVQADRRATARKRLCVVVFGAHEDEPPVFGANGGIPKPENLALRLPGTRSASQGGRERRDVADLEGGNCHPERSEGSL